jgi:hypothetical protein
MLPPGMLQLSARMVWITCWGATRRAERAFASSSTWISRSRPPVTVASATPSMRCKRGRTSFVTTSRMFWLPATAVFAATDMLRMGSEDGS